MIYLFSQIAISLALAAIVGGAAGWLAHRARSGKQIQQLQQVVSRQQQQVNEAQTEVSILAGDFDDLKQQSETEINSLRQDNQKIPALNQNLEKSQLLVRQLLQKHKAELTELSDENEKLQQESKQAEELQKDLTRVQAELDVERRKNERVGSADEQPARAQAELALDDSDDGGKTEAAESTDPKKLQQATAESSADLEDDQIASLDTVNTAEAEAAASKQIPAKPTPARLPLSANTVDSASVVTAAQIPSAAETEAELKALRDQLAEDAPLSMNGQPVVSQPDNSLQTEEDDRELEQMFDPVDQHDDLKQIFGIGPVTEKTLNKLGITAYSQLAELKRHDIEKIADALQIFPGRIERDNWVGGARAQLEEVLEDL